MHATLNDQQLNEKQQRLLDILRSYKRPAVAFSGGVDSALVAKAAVLANGDAAVAVTSVSPSLAQGELEIASQVARQIGIRHEIIQTQEFDVPGYQANAGDRCYYCKTELYDEILSALPRLNADVICNGANLDDQGDHRPGMRAAQEHRVRSPLIEAGFRKQDVRELARLWELPVWDKPASPCLSSRIAYGVEVTRERVRRVDQAEAFLKELLQLRELRVRLEQNELARIELPIAAISQLANENLRLQVVSQFRELGFNFVTLDLEGFRSGSLNQALPLVSLEVRTSAAVSREGSQ
jgi:TIGR00268 family protein